MLSVWTFQYLQGVVYTFYSDHSCYNDPLNKTNPRACMQSLDKIHHSDHKLLLFAITMWPFHFMCVTPSPTPHN